MNKCPRNPRKFLWYKYLGPHRFVYLHRNETHWTSQWGRIINVDQDYRACRLCGLKEKAEWQMIDFGYTKKPRVTGRWIPYDTPEPDYETGKVPEMEQ